MKSQYVVAGPIISPYIWIVNRLLTYSLQYIGAFCSTNTTNSVYGIFHANTQQSPGRRVAGFVRRGAKTHNGADARNFITILQTIIQEPHGGLHDFKNVPNIIIHLY